MVRVLDGGGLLGVDVMPDGFVVRLLVLKLDSNVFEWDRNYGWGLFSTQLFLETSYSLVVHSALAC